jgi:thiamine transport system substrate-binding protein
MTAVPSQNDREIAMYRPRAMAAVAVLTTCAGLFAGCSVSTAPEEAGSADKQVVVATHDSWAMSKDVLRQFTRATGYSVRVEPNGDAGQLTNKLVLTKASPIADMVYGIDNTFASRAVDEGVLTDYTSEAQPASAPSYALDDPRAARQLTPIDYGDVCVNVDDVWFRKHDLAPPRTLGDLTEPRYENLFVTPGASSSSPGLAFLLATIAEYGDGWQDDWKKLMTNGAKLTSGWSDAYEVDFTAGGGNGDRPIVLSYASSPPFTIPEGGRRPTTSSLLDTCFRQVEYAGVLKGAENPEGARAFIDFMTRDAFQKALPDNMYVYPVAAGVALPPTWARYAHSAPRPYTVPASDIARNRDTWLREWGDITTR